MSDYTYSSGIAVNEGDRILYHGEQGEVRFVVSENESEPERQWFLEEFPPGGVMLNAAGFGDVFLTEVDEHLIFVSRRA